MRSSSSLLCRVSRLSFAFALEETNTKDGTWEQQATKALALALQDSSIEGTELRLNGSVPV